MTIHNRNEAIATAINLLNIRGQKKLLEKQEKELQDELREYLHTVKNTKIEFPAGTAKRYFKLASKEGVAVKGGRFKEELPELFKELVEKELFTTYTTEFVDMR